MSFFMMTFDINFMSETFLGDEIKCFSNMGNPSHGEIFFHEENQRTSKKSFIARMSVEVR